MKFFPFIGDNEQEDALDKLNQKSSLRTDEERTAQEEVDAEVFKQIFIPRKLIEVDFPEREIAKVKSGHNIGESYESFDRKRALVKYQSKSDVIKVHSDLLASLRQSERCKKLSYIFEILVISGFQICFQ